MVLLTYGCIIILIIGYLLILGFSFGSGKPIKHILLNAAFGLFGLFAVNITSYFTGIKIPVNIFTVLGSTFYGIPADVFFLIMNLF